MIDTLGALLIAAIGHIDRLSRQGRIPEELRAEVDDLISRMLRLQNKADTAPRCTVDTDDPDLPLPPEFLQDAC